MTLVRPIFDADSSNTVWIFASSHCVRTERGENRTKQTDFYPAAVDHTRPTQYNDEPGAHYRVLSDGRTQSRIRLARVYCVWVLLFRGRTESSGRIVHTRTITPARSVINNRKIFRTRYVDDEGNAVACACVCVWGGRGDSIARRFFLSLAPILRRCRYHRIVEAHLITCTVRPRCKCSRVSYNIIIINVIP